MEKRKDRIMDDLISRAEAIKALGEEPIVWDCDPYEEGMHRQWIDDVEALKELPSAQQWHRGEPSESGDYLCYKYEADDGFGYCYVDTFYTHEGTVEYGTPLAYRGWQDGHDRVLAWMPLPEAPEVEE